MTMKKTLIGIIIAALAVPLFAGTVKTVKGDVDVLIGGKWQKASVGMEVGDSAKIMTSVNSTIRIDNQTGHFIVNELSMVTYHEKSDSKKLDQNVSIDVGKVRVRFTKATGIKSSFKVQTPKGTASVRGTEEDVSYYPGSGMDVDVLEGEVDVGDNNGNSFGAGQGENGGVGQNGGLYSDTDNNQDDSGLNNQFGDDDSQNGSIDTALRDFFNDWLSGNEPERL
jgi:hypothetical protein